MKRLHRSGLILAAMFLLAGCGDRKHPAALVGSWNLDLTQGMIPSQMARFTPAQRQQATAMLSGATLTLSPNGEMTSSSSVARADQNLSATTPERSKGKMTSGNPGAAVGGSGTWEVDGERLKLSSPQAGGRGAPAQRIAPYQLLDGGKTLKMGDPGQEVFWKKP